MSFYLMMLLLELLLSLFFFIRLRLAFGGGWWQAPVLLWIAVMLTLIFWRGSGTLPRTLEDSLSYTWFLWLGFMLFFILAALSLDLAGAVAGRSWWGPVGYKKGVPAALILAVLLSGFAYWQAHHPRLVTVEIFTDKLPAGVDALRLVQLSDIHLGPQIKHKELRRIIALAAEAKPDMVVMTGDMVDSDMSGREADAALLASLKPRYGSFAVLGNHEMYSGGQNSLDFYRLAGLRLLRGEAEAAGGIIVAGMDDEHFGDTYNRQQAAPLLRSLAGDRFVLFLKHRPNLAEGTARLFDLQLSGHTHGGQIWPGHLLILKANGFLSGLYERPEGDSWQPSSANPMPPAQGALYVSRGAGFWGLPMRFFSPPEVNLIVIRRK